MKKLLFFLLAGLCFSLDAAGTVQVKNNLRYGLANRKPDGTLNILNICSFDVDNCQVNNFYRAGVQVPPEKAIVRIVVNGVTIMPGETKDVPAQWFQRFGRGGAFRDGIQGSAFYDDVEVKFTAPNVQPQMNWPTDFTTSNN